MNGGSLHGLVCTDIRNGRAGIPENEKKPSGLPLFFRTLGREWRSLIKLNGIFLLHCLPVITIPAAVCAMQHLTLRMIQDKPLLLWTDYRIAFRSLFKPGLAARLAVSHIGRRPVRSASLSIGSLPCNIRRFLSFTRSARSLLCCLVWRVLIFSH